MARQALAAQAVEVERRRIAAEFHPEIGREREGIVADAVRAGADAGSVEPVLRALVARSRRTLADVRRSPRTIDFHLRNVFRKLGLSSRTQLVRLELDRAQHAGSDGQPRVIRPSGGPLRAQGLSARPR